MATRAGMERACRRRLLPLREILRPRWALDPDRRTWESRPAWATRWRRPMSFGRRQISPRMRVALTSDASLQA